MRRLLFALLISLLAISSLASAGQILQIDQSRNLNSPSFLGYAPDRIIVVMKPGVGSLNTQTMPNGVVHIGDTEFDKISDRFAVSGIMQQFVGSESKSAELAKYHKVRIEAGTVDEALEAYRNHPMVESVEPVGIHAMYATPNDFYYSYQWHLNQASDHDIDAPEAWDIEAGADATVVAILDSGTRYYHPDLGGVNASPSNPGASRGNMWINTTELNGSAGVDDDGNGYTDDWIGYDFIDGVSNCWSGEDCNDKDNDPRDFNGHGTHTSGIFGMLTNDDYGMCGVAGGWGNGTQTEYGNGVKIMALRMGYSYNYLGQEYGVVMMDAAAEAFYYAADNGAKIASCSWGSSNSGGIGTAATYFLNAGGIIVVAAGNDGGEVSPDYLNGRGDCISVAATDENDNGASFTTYGTWVDICAPGDNIYSTYHDHNDPATNYWAAMGGTSMSAPMVAGVVALIWSQNPSWTATQVTNQLYSSADNIDAYLTSKYIGKMGAGRINAYEAVNTGPPPPVAEFSGSPTSGCVPLTVDFTDLSTGDITSWSWDFGDLGTSTQQNPSHQYTSDGTYTVSLTVTGPGGSDGETKTDYITVNVPPTAGFNGSPTSGEVPLTVDFTDQSTGATSWSWDFGDTGSSTATNPSHTYTDAGTFTVSLTATNSCGSDDEVKVDYITVTCTPPVADFTGSPTSGDAPLTVDFTDLSTGATSWSWDFGDGVGTSTAQNPSYVYDDAGTYTVTLTATNACGSDDEVKIDYITVTCTAPVADFSGSPTSGTAPLLVDFTDLSTGGPTGWSWDFGDGVGTSTAQNPSYTYNSVGTYTVTLTATNSCGSDIASKVDYITVTESFEAKAYANADIPVYGTVSGSYTNTIASDDVYETITEIEYTGHPVKRYSYLEHKWTINVGSGGDNMTFFLEAYRAANSDGDDFDFAYSTDDATYLNLVTVASATEQVYSTALPAGLTGTIYVRVLDTDRSWDNVSLDPVHVDQMYIEYSSEPVPPVANFSGTPTSGSYPLLVNFTDLSTGSPTSWSWDFGDGVGTSADRNPSYTYTAVGSYTVSLTATNANGSDNETKLDYITVTEPGEDYSHVDNMQVGRRKVGPNYLGTCTVTIFDYYNAPLANATVYADYDGPTNGSAAGVTGGDGTVVLESSSMKKPVGEWCFEVTDVTHATHTYDAGSNNVTRACESGWVYGEGKSPFVLEKGTLPESFALHQNNPNPFNPTTEISFDLPVGCNVRLEIFNVLGQDVATLVDQYLSPGEYSFKWNANGEPSGVYLYRVTTDSYTETRKMVLMK